MVSFSCSGPGGVHLGILPAAGLREDAGLDVETMEDKGGLFGASLAVGGLLTGVEAADRQVEVHNRSQKLNLLSTLRTNLLPGIWTLMVLVPAFPFWRQEAVWSSHY